MSINSILKQNEHHESTIYNNRAALVKHQNIALEMNTNKIWSQQWYNIELTTITVGYVNMTLTQYWFNTC